MCTMKNYSFKINCHYGVSLSSGFVWEVNNFGCFSYDFQMTLASDKDTDSISVTSIGSSTQRLLQDLIVIDVYGVQPAGITRLLNSALLSPYPPKVLNIK